MKLSKSKLSLAKVINENGGWIDDSANWAVQPKHEEGDIWFSNGDNKPYRNEGMDGFTFDGRGLWLDDIIKHDKLHQNWHQCVLSREEYYQAYPEAGDGWIEWKGGECPVGKNVTGDIKLACGEKFDTTDMAMWNWHLGNGNPRSIIAYRQHKPEVKPEFCESVMRSIPEPELDDSESRLAKALELVKMAAPHLLSDKYKFNGDEVMGERKPAIEQLAQDYRNAKDYANRLQKEAGEAAAKAEEFAVEIRKKLLELQELIWIPNPEKEPELEITDWRDLMVGDEVECTEYDTAHRFGVVCRIDESSEEQPIMVNHGDGKGISWPSSWKFIRIP